MTARRHATDRPFTVVVCAACSAAQDMSVIEELRATIRRCPRAMLVSAECMLGQFACLARPSGDGVIALLQPCTNDRAAFGPPRWIGPIADRDDAAALRDWLELGEWERVPLPAQLGRHDSWLRNARQSN